MLTRIAILVTCSAAFATALVASEAVVAVSADTAGHVGPCTACPHTVGHGGLARRATLLADLRSQHPDLVLVDAGHALWGPESLESGGRVITSAYAELDYAVMNLSWRDFRLGLAATRELATTCPVPMISANLFAVDADAGSEALFDPSVVIERGDERIGVVGCTAVPAAAIALPHLAEQLADISWRDPAAVVPGVVAELQPRVDRVLVAFDGDRAALVRLLAALEGSAVEAVLVAGLRPGDLPADATLPLVASHRHGAALATWNGETVAQHHILPEMTADPALRELVAELQAPEPAAPAPVLATRLSALPEPGTASEFLATGASRGLEIQVLGARVVDDDAARDPLLVLDTEWINTVPIDLVLDLGQPQATQMPSVPRRCFLEIDGARLRRVAEAGMALDGALPESFVLPESGAAQRGSLAFRVPRDATSLRLHVMHDRFGPVVVDLGPSAPPAAEAVVGPSANAALELGVFGLERTREWGGQAAPTGSSFLVVDLRGRSRMAITGDARALDRAAAADAPATIPVAFEYLHGHEMIQLLVDGRLLCRRVRELEELPAAPAFVPDAMAGGRLVFLIPEDAERLELACQFPRFELAKSAIDVSALEPCVFALAGDPAAAAEAEPLATMPGSPIACELLAAREAETVAGQAPPEGRAWVVLRLALRNAGDEGGMFPLAERCRLSGSDWTAEVHELTAAAVHAPPPRMWLPAGGRRAAEVAFAVPAAARSATLAVTLVDGTGTVGLNWGADGAVAAAEATDAETDAAVAAGEPAPADAPTPAAESDPATAVESPEAAEPAEPTLAELLGAGREPRGLAGVGLRADDVNDAIDRGRAFLWQYLRQEWGGGDGEPVLSAREDTHVLAALALVHAEAHHEWPECDREIRRFISEYPRETRTYELALYLMLVRAYNDPRFRGHLREATIAMLNGQRADGTWGYGTGPWPEAAAGPTAVLTVHGGKPLDGDGDEPEALERSVALDPESGNGDNSLTQFAVLGLRSAEKAGFAVPEDAWRRIHDCFSARQGDDGGWAYRTGRSYGSMTCAGICSLVIARHALGEEPAVGGERLRRGLALVAERFNPSANFGHEGKWDFYYRYSYERVGRLLDAEFFGEHEWYPLGAKVLVDAQREDGGWVGGHSEEKEPEVATSFALLFLTRATEQLGPEAIERGGDGSLATLARRPADRAVHVIFDASGSMLQPVAEGARETRFEQARNALVTILDDLAPGTPVGLRVYGHRLSAIEEGAGEDTELVLPIAPLVIDTYSQVLSRLRARGRTPMALSLRQAIRDARSFDGEVTLLLLTDGGEDPQSAYDPVAEAAAIADRDGIELEILGLAIDRADWREQLAAMATAAGGTYWPVADARELAPRLRQALLEIPEFYVLFDDAGEEVLRGRFGDVHEGLPEGRYLLRTSFGGQVHERELWINTGVTTSVSFDARAVEPAAVAEPATVIPEPGAPPAPAADDARPVFCAGCGQRLPSEGRFCPTCGRQIQ